MESIHRRTFLIYILFQIRIVGHPHLYSSFGRGVTERGGGMGNNRVNA